MTNYKCNKCNKDFTQKSHYIRHLIRKSPCDIILNIKKNTYVKDILDNYSLTCIFCNNNFSTNYNLTKHMKNSCKEIKRREQIKHDIFIKLKEDQILKDEEKMLKTKIQIAKNAKLKYKLDKLERDMQVINKNSHNIITTTNSNNTTNNIVNNIVLIGYGKEDFAKIPEKKIKQIFNRGYMSCVGLTDEIHFNPKYPEYHNVYISSMKDKYAMMYNGTEWKLVGKTELIDSIYDDKKEYIEENIDDFCDSLTGSKKDAIYNWLKMDHDDDKIKEMKEEIKLLLYNKKHIPIKTKST
jgi:hypothetical protein